MEPSQILAAITGAGGALVVLGVGFWLMINGKLHTNSAMQAKDREIAERDRQIVEWRSAWIAERLRADNAVLGLQTTNAVLSALHREVGQ
jgi:hypothetical protein